MKTKFIERNAYQQAYQRWFARYDVERRRQKKRMGAAVDLPGKPTNPDDIAHVVDALGVRRVLSTLEIHRSTLARWLAGTSVIPHPAWLLLVLMAEGRLPGMSEDWRQFRFDGDTLTIPGTRFAYTARQIAGWPYQLALIDALNRRITELEKEKAHLLQVGYFEAANDPIARRG